MTYAQLIAEYNRVEKSIQYEALYGDISKIDSLRWAKTLVLSKLADFNVEIDD